MTIRKCLNLLIIFPFWFLLSACPPIEKEGDCLMSECCFGGLCQTGMECGSQGYCESDGVTCQCTDFGVGDGDWGTTTTAMQGKVSSGPATGTLVLPIDRLFTLSLGETAKRCKADSAVVRLPLQGKITLEYRRGDNGVVTFRLRDAALTSDGTELPCLGATGPVTVQLDRFEGTAGPKAMSVRGTSKGKAMVRNLNQTFPFGFEFEAEVNARTGRPQAAYSNLKTTLK